MRPVLFDLSGLSVNGYGVSKAAAALVAGFPLVWEFRRMGWDEDRGWTLVLATTFFGLVGEPWSTPHLLSPGCSRAKYSNYSRTS